MPWVRGQGSVDPVRAAWICASSWGSGQVLDGAVRRLTYDQQRQLRALADERLAEAVHDEQHSTRAERVALAHQTRDVIAAAIRRAATPNRQDHR